MVIKSILIDKHNHFLMTKTFCQVIKDLSFNSNIFLSRSDLAILTVYIYNYKWPVSKCNMNSSVFQNGMHAHLGAFLHGSSASSRTKTMLAGDDRTYSKKKSHAFWSHQSHSCCMAINQIQIHIAQKTSDLSHWGKKKMICVTPTW